MIALICAMFLVSGCIASDDQQSKKEKGPEETLRQTFAAKLQPLEPFDDDTAVNGFLPCEKRRLRGRKISRLTQEIDTCISEKQFALLCARVSKLQDRYRDYEKRKDFVITEGNSLTGAEVINDMLIDGLFRVAVFKRWNSATVPQYKNQITPEIAGLKEPHPSFATTPQETHVLNQQNLVQEATVQDQLRSDGIRIPISPYSPICPYIPKERSFFDSDDSDIRPSSHWTTFVSSHDSSSDSKV